MSGSPARRRRRAAARAHAKITAVRQAIDDLARHPTGPNLYVCRTCDGYTVTRHAAGDEGQGVTPALIACRARSDGTALVCEGEAASRFYPSPPLPRELAELPVWEWYRPEPGDPVLAAPGMSDHVARGGLALRGPFPPDWAEEMIAR